MTNTKLVIIGAGVAAVSAIQAIRQHDMDIDITVYGRESYLPYKRLRLTKDLAYGLKLDNLLLHKESWYQDNKISFHTNIQVKAIDTDKQSILLSDGTTEYYSYLLLANGASNNVLPIKGIEKSGVFTLRTLEDAKNIQVQVEKSNKILIIGGGVLGLEMAWGLKQLGKDVIVVEALPRLMPKQLDNLGSEILLDIVQGSDVKVLTGTQVREITGDFSVTGFITDKDEKYPCDMVIHCTGIRPNIELVKDTGIYTNRGVLVNERMETNIPGIYAAGDIAEYNNQIPGLWNVASLQGEVAGNNIAGSHKVYEVPISPVAMNAYHYSMFSVGQIDDESFDTVLVDIAPEDKKYQKIMLKENKIVGAIIMGSIRELPSIRRAMEEQTIFTELHGQDLTPSEFLQLLKERQKKKQLHPTGAAAQ